MNRKLRYYGLIFVIYMFVFQFGLMQISSIFNYWDELYALFCIPLFFVAGRKYKLKKTIYNRLIFLLALYIFSGLLANILYKYQGFKGIAADILLQVKFYLGIAATYYLFRRINLERYRNRIKKHIKAITILLFLLMVANKIVHVFSIGDVRFGISSEKLFFGHPTGLGSVSFFLTVLLMLFYKKNSRDNFYVAMGIMLVLSTLRFKAIAAVLFFCYMYFVLVVLNKKLTVWKTVSFAPIAFIAGWEEFYEYFFSAKTMDLARGALFRTGLRLARDYFPLGTGLGTFASDPSGLYYSPIYAKYGISTVWGLARDNSFLVSDTFWAMLLGQTGVIGTLLYVMIIICLFKMIKPAYRIDKGLYLAGVGALVYLLVSSIAESAFVNPMALPLALIIGLITCLIEQGEKRITIK